MKRLWAVIAIAGSSLWGAAGCDSQDGGAAANAPAAEAQHTKTKAGEVKNGFDGMPQEGTKAMCPVMEHEFTVKKDSPTTVHNGKTYVFCCPSCVPKFVAEPDKYIKS